MNTCPKCNASIKENQAFCDQCGTKIENQSFAEKKNEISAEAHYEKGISLLTGKDGTRDLPNATASLLNASEMGFGPAMYTLGMMYLRGVGVTQSQDKAKSFIQKASDKQVKLALDALVSLNSGGKCENFPILSTGKLMQSPTQAQDSIPAPVTEQKQEVKTINAPNKEQKTESVVTSQEESERPLEIPNANEKTTQTPTNKNKLIIIAVAVIAVVAIVAIAGWFIYSKKKSEEIKVTGAEMLAPRQLIEGYLEVKDGWGYISYVGEESGDWVPYFFKLDSNVGRLIMSTCKANNFCDVNGVARDISDKEMPIKMGDDGPSASAMFLIVIAENAKFKPDTRPKEIEPAPVEERISSVDLKGSQLVINNTYDTKTISYNQNTIYKSDGILLEVVKTFKLPNSEVALVADSSGGTACPVQYVFISVDDNNNVKASKGFGTCNDNIKTTQEDDRIIITIDKAKYVYSQNEVKEEIEKTVEKEPEVVRQPKESTQQPVQKSQVKPKEQKVTKSKKVEEAPKKEKGGIFGALNKIKKALPKGEAPKQDNPWD